MDNIIIRRASKTNDLVQLKGLYQISFPSEGVDKLAEVLYAKLPGMKQTYWMVAEDTNIQKIIAAFVLIPWQWSLEGTTLKVAEMGLVATLPEYRGKGLMHRLNKEFDKTIKEEGFHFSVIQGIPGFYHKFGYQYSVEMENHIIVPLHILIDEKAKTNYNFRKAEPSDIEFLNKQGEVFSKEFPLSVIRNEANWQYLLENNKDTGYDSELWIIENADEKYCLRILLQGFGPGLIISEISNDVSIQAMQAIFQFLGKEAKLRNKPYLRLNMHRETAAAKFALSNGAEFGKSYAWQIKIHDVLFLLNDLKKVFEKRLSESVFKSFSGVLRLDFYAFSFDIDFETGKIKSIGKGGEQERANTFCINEKLFPVLCLGHRSWEEIQNIHPDVFAIPMYLDPKAGGINSIAGQLTSVLFPKLKGWINLQY